MALLPLSSSSDDQDLPRVGGAWSGGGAAAIKPFTGFGLVSAAASLFRSLLPTLHALLIPSCSAATSSLHGWLTPSAAPPPSGRRRRRRLTGTFYGRRRGRVSFAVQDSPGSDPALLLELATPTARLAREMASGSVRILLECDRSTPTAGPTAGNYKGRRGPQGRRLWEEPVWTMYCNGHRLGYAVARACAEGDRHVLGAVGAVSVGAGVLPAAGPAALPSPVEGEGAKGGGEEVMYMRARFERVVGSKDSEAFYMINPDGNGSGGGGSNGGPELSIFLLRI